MKDLTVHMISHTHWDREWYAGSRYTNEWLPSFFERLFAMLDREKEYRFVLDGQMGMVEDCLAQLKKEGRDARTWLRRLKGYAGEGRLVLGPYYVQPDWQLVSGEALVRNLELGRELALACGKVSPAGWLPDNFGQISQAPQLHRQFGIPGIFVWRGVEMDPAALRSEFTWRSPDGSEVLTVYLLDGYRNGVRLAAYPEIFSQRIREEAGKLRKFSTTGQLLMMNGFDQETNPDDILPLIRQTEEGPALRQSTPAEYLEAVAREHPQLPVLEGALYSGRYISVFPGTLSARMYLKLQNDWCQTMLSRYAEPLQALLELLELRADGPEGTAAPGAFELRADGPEGTAGYDISELPAGRCGLSCLWKLLLQNHPHDSICGVGVDEVHADMEKRFHACGLGVLRFCRDGMRQLAAGVPARVPAGLPAAGGTQAPLSLLVFNPYPAPRDSIVLLQGTERVLQDAEGRRVPAYRTKRGTVYRLAELPAYGYRAYYQAPEGPEEAEEPGETAGVTACSADGEDGQDLPVLENRYLRAQLCGDGTFTVWDKESGRRYDGIAELEDCADTGDEYTFCGMPGDGGIRSGGRPARVELLEKNPFRTVARVLQVLELPSAYDRETGKRSGRLVKLPVELTAILAGDSRMLQFEVRVQNTVRDHRLRLLFPTDLKADRSFTRTQFDIVTHPVRPRETEEELPEEVRRIVIGARETEAIRTFPQGDLCGLTDGLATAAVLNKGLPEYEILEDRSTIAVTLCRSVSWLARTDLHTRTGDAGPVILTPDAACLRSMEASLAFCPFRGTWEEVPLNRWADLYQTPVMLLECDGNVTGEEKAYGAASARAGKALPAESSLLRLSGGKKQMVTSLRVKGQELQLRLCHPGNGEETVLLDPGFPVRQAETVTLLGTKLRAQAPLRTGSGTAEGGAGFAVTLGPHEIRTVSFLKPERTLRETADGPQPAGTALPAACRLLVRERPPFLRKRNCFPQEPVITREEAEAEKRREQHWERAYRETAAAFEAAGGRLCRETAALYQERESRKRTWLETRLSALYAEEKYRQLQGGTGEESRRLEDEIRRTAAWLRETRLTRRASEYVTDYYSHQPQPPL